MSEAVAKRKRGRPRKDEPNRAITPKKQPVAKQKVVASAVTDMDFFNWMVDCALIVLPGWELKATPYKHYNEVRRYNIEQELMMPFAFVDMRNGNIHCPALMHGDPHEYVRGNINDPLTRTKDITPHGVAAGWPWQPTHPDYKPIDNLDLSAIKH